MSVDHGEKTVLYTRENREQEIEEKINTKHFQQLMAKALFSQYSVPFGQHW